MRPLVPAGRAPAFLPRCHAAAAGGAAAGTPQNAACVRSCVPPLLSQKQRQTTRLCFAAPFSRHKLASWRRSQPQQRAGGGEQLVGGRADRRVRGVHAPITPCPGPRALPKPPSRKPERQPRQVHILPRDHHNTDLQGGISLCKQKLLTTSSPFALFGCDLHGNGRMIHLNLRRMHPPIGGR